MDAFQRFGYLSETHMHSFYNFFKALAMFILSITGELLFLQ